MRRGWFVQEAVMVRQAIFNSMHLFGVHHRWWWYVLVGVVALLTVLWATPSH